MLTCRADRLRACVRRRAGAAARCLLGAGERQLFDAEPPLALPGAAADQSEERQGGPGGLQLGYRGLLGPELGDFAAERLDLGQQGAGREVRLLEPLGLVAAFAPLAPADDARGGRQPADDRPDHGPLHQPQPDKLASAARPRQEVDRLLHTPNANADKAIAGPRMEGGGKNEGRDEG